MEEIDLNDNPGKQNGTLQGKDNNTKADKKLDANGKPKKSRWQRIMRTRPHLFLIFVVSIVGFCYHFNIALNQYWEYKTTVSFSNEDPKDYKFQYPSATLCFQDVVPYFKLIKEYPEYEENVKRINEEMSKRNDTNFWTNPETKKFITLTGAKSMEGKKKS